MHDIDIMTDSQPEFHIFRMHSFRWARTSVFLYRAAGFLYRAAVNLAPADDAAQQAEQVTCRANSSSSSSRAMPRTLHLPSNSYAQSHHRSGGDDDDGEPQRRKKEVNPHDAKWLVHEGGEQGYYDSKNEWVTTGWHDAEGYWFEACGEFDARGKWRGTGKFDVWDPDGDWYETGYFDENEEWVVEVSRHGVTPMVTRALHPSRSPVDLRCSRGAGLTASCCSFALRAAPMSRH
jgi:hypothetical protein